MIKGKVECEIVRAGKCPLSCQNFILDMSKILFNVPEQGMNFDGQESTIPPRQKVYDQLYLRLISFIVPCIFKSCGTLMPESARDVCVVRY